MSARIGRVFSVTVTTALYRRYRPDSFADVIGQEHVTGPLMTALRKNRVNHAYLFSGPRGCGKTTSARILARCLNCAEGPTDTPCGVCPSCIELARGGPGSLDVIEIDAASHGGVDDARDLRERATFAPVRDRYKIFIIDEAHMVTSAGFNALLKIVEEPPEHIKFIFATTEPDKVIGTIRSRTHHYPFRLVPPEPLMAYLELLCNQENVPVAPGVLSLVIRAGAGSVRDSLSVLDQLMAGAGPNGLDYELAVALLGYTHASLLDDVVEAVAASDAATVFRAVDRVIQTGHDPRRFVEDLLERFRDLIIVQAMPESAHAILRGMPADQIARLQNQAHNLGAAELSRAADVTNTALTEMTGATSPRLHLELLCARILLPSSEQNERGIAARIDRVERRLNYAGNDVGAPAGQAAGVATGGAATGEAAAPPTAKVQVPAAQQSRPQPVSPPADAGHQRPAAAGPQTAPEPAQEQARPATPAASAQGGAADGRTPLTPPRVSTSDWPVEQAAASRQAADGAPGQQHGPGPGAPSPAGAADRPAVEPAQATSATASAGRPGTGAAAAAPVPAGTASSGTAPSAPASGTTPAGPVQGDPATAGPAPAASAPKGMGDVEVLRRAWPDVLQSLARIKRSTWALVEPNAQVSTFDGNVLTLSFTTSGLAGAFGRADHSENLRQAIQKTVGIDCQINAISGAGAASGGTGQASSEPNPKAPATKAATATSADVAWGLAPAVPAPAPAGSAPSSPVQPASAPSTPAAPEPAAAPPAPPATRLPAAPGGQAPGMAPGGDRPEETLGGHGPGEAGSHVPGDAPSGAASNGRASRDVGAGGATPGSATPGTQAGSNATPDGPERYPALGGDYSYSDDDWGPPRDEDAPPLEEEPPMDWTPPSGAGQRGKTQDQTGNRPAASRTDGPDGQSSAAPVRPNGPSGDGAATSPGAATAPDAAHDPWARAVEQAPGVWVVGTESNIGRTTLQPAPAGQAGESGGSAGTPPRYEPATAQVPPSIPVTAPASSGPGPGVPPAAPETAVPAPAREYAMASAGPSQATPPAGPAAAPSVAPSAARAAAPSPAAPSPAATAPATAHAAAPAPGNTRQSLYQRLSNSPEAEAGRAKAPARAATTPAAYVQDIPSADDETIEESGVFGRAAVERILGGKLIEERSPDGSPIVPRY